MSTVIVTIPEYRKAEVIFTNESGNLTCIPSSENEADLAAAIRRHQAQHVILGVEKYDKELYQALPGGAVIARFGVGHDGVDKEQASARGQYCINTPGVLDDSVAEHCLGLMLSLSRNLPSSCATVANGGWEPSIGGELRAKRLAIIGCGAIGRRVAKIAAHGFGMTVVACCRTRREEEELRNNWGVAEICTDFATAVADADVVSLHLPANAATQDFINAERLAMLPANARFINTARGSIVDEAALFDALATGKLGAAALDVFAREPYVPNDPKRDLRTLANVVLTPHIGSSTRAACERMARAAIRGIQEIEAGRLDSVSLLNPRADKTGI